MSQIKSLAQKPAQNSSDSVKFKLNQKHIKNKIIYKPLFDLFCVNIWC